MHAITAKSAISVLFSIKIFLKFVFHNSGSGFPLQICKSKDCTNNDMVGTTPHLLSYSMLAHILPFPSPSLTTSSSFFPFQEIYQMPSLPLGQALVINIKKFDNSSERKGSEVDKTKIEALLRDTLHFEVTTTDREDLKMHVSFTSLSDI